MWEDLPENLQSELSKFAAFMGKLIYGTIYDDGIAVGSVFQNLEVVKELNTQDFISARNSLTSAFFAGATGVNSNHEHPGKLKALAHLHEQLLYVRNLKLVTPFAFQRNLITYSTTGSKTILSLTSQTSLSLQAKAFFFHIRNLIS